ncbi:MAG: hypothetical protein WBW81_01260 [Methylocella sp.]
MAKPKTWVPTSAEQALLVDLVTARMPRAEIAKRMGISEMKLRRFEKRLLSAREAMPPPRPGSEVLGLTASLAIADDSGVARPGGFSARRRSGMG